MVTLLAAAALPVAGFVVPAQAAPRAVDLRSLQASHAAQMSIPQATAALVPSRSLRSAPSQGSTVLRYVTAARGNVRSGPGTSYRVVGTIDHGYGSEASYAATVGWTSLATASSPPPS